METTSLQTELVYLFSKFSSMENVYLFFILTSSLMFLNVVDLQGLDLCLVVLPLIVEDCLKLQHYCPDITENSHLRFINSND